MKYAISSSGAPSAFGHYSQGTTAGRLVFTAGQLGLDPQTNTLVSGGIEAEVDQAITNVESILAEVGCTLDDVAKVTVYLTNIEDYDMMNRVYARRFPSPEPARSVVEVSALPKGALVELECIACR